MTEPIIVTAAIIPKNGLYLLTRRPLDKHLGGLWEFPGGKLEPEDGGSLERCIEREIKEELGIRVKAISEFGRNAHTYEGGPTIDLRAYNWEYLSGSITKIGVEGYRWVFSGEMSDYEMPEADIPFVIKLREMTWG